MRCRKLHFYLPKLSEHDGNRNCVGYQFYRRHTIVIYRMVTESERNGIVRKEIIYRAIYSGLAGHGEGFGHKNKAACFSDAREAVDEAIENFRAHAKEINATLKLLKGA